MKKRLILGLMGLFVVGLLAVAALALPLQNESVRDAIKNHDYNAWKEAMISQLTEERFNQEVDRFEKMSERKNEMDEVMAQGYEAWAEMMGDNPITEQITAENFDLFVEMHEARDSGDFETATEIAAELGLEKEMGKFNPRGPPEGGRHGGCPMMD